MNLIININDENVISDIKNHCLVAQSKTDTVIIDALYNGILIPEGCKLIDANALDIDNLDRAYDDNFELDFGRLYIKDVIDMIANAKPIIEVDKESEK